MPGPLNATRLTGIVTGCLEQCGLGVLAVDRKGRHYQYEAAPEPLQIRAVEGDDPAAALRREIEEQINLPFPSEGRFCPFRFFTVRDGESFFLGLAYYHPIAGDLPSIISLFRQIVLSYLSGEQSAGCPPVELYPGTYMSLLRISPSDIFRWICSFPGRIAGVRRSVRPRYADMRDNRNGYRFFSIGTGPFRSLTRASKSWDVTLNDMFLALVMQSVAPRALKRRKGKKTHISISSIVSIRKDIARDSENTFGLFLSSFNVSHPVPEGTPLSALARDIRSQTGRIKRHRLYLRTLLELSAALVLIPLFFRTRKEKFYVKYNPVWAGITNVNIDAAGGWPAHPGDVSADYLRAVSTGQAAPLIFSFTTLHDKIQVGVSYRKTVFSEGDIGEILSDFSQTISHIDGVSA